ELEEERRLCYVGMTRAKERLYLTCAQQRMLYGEPVASAVSRFVGEIPEHLVENRSEEIRAQAARARWQVLPGGRAGRPGFGPVTMSLAGLGAPAGAGRTPGAGANAPAAAGAGAAHDWRPGDKVYHRAWGQGTIVSCESSAGDLILTVAFPGQGVKKLLAS